MLFVRRRKLLLIEFFPLFFRVNDQRRFDYCILQLKDPTDNDLADPRHIPLEKARHWPLVQLCATTVTTASPELLARSANPEHIAHALQETAIVSSTLFHIIERMSFAATVLDAAQSVLSSVAAESGGGGGRSAPPTALVAGSMSTNSSAVLPAVRISLLRDDTAMARRRVDEMDADEVADPVAGAGPSTAFLTKWSAEASEAFCGEFQLKPELMTATQALM